MPQSDYDRLSARFDEMKVNRTNTDTTRQEIADNLLGRRDFVTKRTPGQNRMQRIYDDTSKVSGGLLAGAIHSLMMSPSADWFEFRFRNQELNDNADAVAWLKAAEKRIKASLDDPKANFHAQLAEVFIDLIFFGMGAMFIDDVAGQGIEFSARPIQELYIAQNPAGRIDTIGRMFELTARQAVNEWGDKAETADKALNDGNSEVKHTYIHLIVPRDDVVVGNIDASGMEWASFFLSVEDRIVIDEGGFREMPMVTPRWEVEAGEVDGRGPGWNALSNQKMLNEMKRVRIIAGQLGINPVKMIDSEGVLGGDLNFHPGGIIPVNAVMSQMDPPVQILPISGDSRMTTEDIIDTRQAIQGAFLHQLVEMLRDARMTATQVLELAAQMQRHMAPILGRIETELGSPIVKRVFAIELRAGRLPPAPSIITDADYDIVYVNPVARAQKTSSARAILDFQGAIVEVSKAVPDVLHIPKWDEQTRLLADAFGVPPTSINDEREVEVIRSAARELAAEQQQAEQAVMATDQIAKLAKAMPQQQGAA